MRALVSIAWLSLVTFSARADWSPDKKDELNVKIGIMGPQLEVAVKALKGVQAAPITYSPHVPGQAFISLGYRNLGVSIAAPPVATEDDKRDKGETRLSDYQFRLYGRRITQEYFYQTYKGYYIQNSADVDPSYTGSLKIQRPDLKSVNYGFNYLYNVSPADYSMGAAFDQSGRQKKSDGALLIMLSGRHQEMGGDTPIIPAQLAAAYAPDDTITKASFSILGAGLGYGHTFVFRDFYFSGQLVLGWTLEQRKYSRVDQTTDGESRTGNTAAAKLGLGYNGESNYSGIQILVDNSVYSFEKAQLGSTAMVLSFFYGHRFDGVNLVPLNPISDLFD